MIKFYSIHYNNYYNRILKKLTEADDYLDATFFTAGHEVENVSFNPADGLKTTQVVNYDASSDDYAIVVRETTVENVTTKEVLSRWFIMKADRTRTGQYILTLKRDVLADNFNSLLTAPMFVHKGILDQDDPMICNSEGMVFNEIKVGEELLKSKFDCPWIVGYVAKDALGKQEVQFEGGVAPAGAVALSAIESDIGRSLDVENTDTVNILADSFGYNFTILEGRYRYSGDFAGYEYSYWIDRYFNVTELNYIKKNFFPNQYVIAYKSTAQSYPPIANDVYDNAIRNVMYSLRNDTLAAFKQSFAIDNLQNAEILSKLNNYVGKYILSDGRYYKMNLRTRAIVSGGSVIYGDGAGAQDYLPTANSAFDTAFQSLSIPGYEKTENHYRLSISNICIDQLEISFEDVTEDATDTYKIPLADDAHRRHASGAVYDLFAIPFGEVYWGAVTGPINLITEPSKISIGSRELLLKAAANIAEQLGAKCYDVQLLPYMPALEPLWRKARKIRVGSDSNIFYDSIDLTHLAEGYDYNFITKTPAGGSASNVGLIFWLKNANEQLVINKEYNYINSPDRKIESNTTKFRLCSPNYNGLFDMNLARNKGIDYFNVSISFKPYQPYIHIQPNFKDLYSNTDYKDYRGLICGGDFSLSRVTDAWINYQLQNVNYQKIFDRGIQNLDFSQSQEAKISKIQAGLGVITGGAAGATAGALIGGGYGAAAGAAAGLVASSVGGVADISMLKERQAEIRDYEIDKFNYQLGNIRALPDSLTKVDLFNPDSRYFPFIEMYCCSEKETEALERKVQFNGMTVERVDYLENFRSEDNSKWFSATLIRNLNIDAEAEMFYVINEELIKGVYI